MPPKKKGVNPRNIKAINVKGVDYSYGDILDNYVAWEAEVRIVEEVMRRHASGEEPTIHSISVFRNNIQKRIAANKKTVVSTAKFAHTAATEKDFVFPWESDPGLWEASFTKVQGDIVELSDEKKAEVEKLVKLQASVKTRSVQAIKDDAADEKEHEDMAISIAKNAVKTYSTPSNIALTVMGLPKQELLKNQDPDVDSAYPVPPDPTKTASDEYDEKKAGTRKAFKNGKVAAMWAQARSIQMRGLEDWVGTPTAWEAEEKKNMVDVSDFIDNGFFRKSDNHINKYLRIPRIDRRIMDNISGGSTVKSFFAYLDKHVVGNPDGLGVLFAKMNGARIEHAKKVAKATGPKYNELVLKTGEVFSQEQKIIRKEKVKLKKGPDHYVQRLVSPSLYWILQYITDCNGYRKKDKKVRHNHDVHSDITAISYAINYWTRYHWLVKPISTGSEKKRAEIVNKVFTHLKPLVEATALTFKSETGAYTDIAKSISMEKISKGVLKSLPRPANYTPIPLSTEFTNDQESVYKYYEFSALDPEKKRYAKQLHELNLTTQNITPIDFEYSAVLAAKTAWMNTDNTDWLQKVLLVQLATGSRFIEVLKISDFYGPGDIPGGAEAIRDHHIVVHKVAKTKAKRGKYVAFYDAAKEDAKDQDLSDEPLERQLPPKPTLFIPPSMVRYLVYKIIRPAVKKVVEAKWGKGHVPTNVELTGEFNTKANKLLRAQFSTTIDDEKHTAIKGTHTLRKIYANLSYDMYSDKVMSKNAWITRVLGHEPTSVTTSLSYTGLNVKQGAPEVEDRAATDRINELQQVIKDHMHEVKTLMAKSGKRPREDDKAPEMDLDDDEDDPYPGDTLMVRLSNGRKIPKWAPRGYKESDESVIERYKAHVARIKQAGLRDSWATLIASGLGANTISKMKKATSAGPKAKKAKVQ